MPRRRSPVPPIRAGQVWAHARYHRSPSLFEPQPVRTFRIIRVDFAEATVVSDAGRTSRIALSRLRPTRKGYQLLRDVPGPGSAA